MSRIPLTEGRSTFGDDPAGYAAVRPEYPDALYTRLTERCALGRGSVVFEVGPGTGLATRRVLDLGVAALRAIEPDPRMATFLRQNMISSVLRIDEIPFEDLNLPAASFDLGIAATSFHWVNQAQGHAKAKDALKQGGWWATWWTNFGADGEYDAFQCATDHLFVNTPEGPSQGRNGGPPFALDYDARLSDLAAAGFQDAEVDLWRWNLHYETSRLVDLYRTFSPIRALGAEQRELFLHNLACIADKQFGGCVERPFTTALYTARRA